LGLFFFSNTDDQHCTKSKNRGCNDDIEWLRWQNSSEICGRGAVSVPPRFTIALWPTAVFAELPCRTLRILAKNAAHKFNLQTALTLRNHPNRNHRLCQDFFVSLI
jgi:hypothetical protein